MPALTPSERVARHRARTLTAGGRRVELLLDAAEARLLAQARAELGAASDAAALLECLRRVTAQPRPSP